MAVGIPEGSLQLGQDPFVAEEVRVGEETWDMGS